MLLGWPGIIGCQRRPAPFESAADPGETANLVEDGGIALRLTRTALAWELAADGRWKRSRWGTGANLKPAFALDQGM